MSRPPDGKEPRTQTLHTRITPTGLQVLDRLRGTRTRSQYIRDLIAADAHRKGHQ